MNDNSLVIRNNVLVKYEGNDAIVAIPDSVTGIGSDAFVSCRRLASATLPGGARYIRSLSKPD